MKVQATRKKYNDEIQKEQQKWITKYQQLTQLYFYYNVWCWSFCRQRVVAKGPSPPPTTPVLDFPLLLKDDLCKVVKGPSRRPSEKKTAFQKKTTFAKTHDQHDPTHTNNTPHDQHTPTTQNNTT